MRQTVLRLAAGSMLGLSVLLSFTAHAQQQQLAQLPSAWTVLDKLPADVEAAEPWIRPSRMQPVALDVGAMRALLANAPLETTPGARGNALMLELPRPDGTLAFFHVLESPVMAPELQARYPQIRTYIAQGVDDATEVARFDLTPAGFHAQVLSTHGSWYIDPVSRNDTTHYASYWKRDLRPRGVFRCLTADHDGVPNSEEEVTPQGGVDALTIGPTLRTYRLAVAATGEYTAFHGGTVPLGLAAIVTSVNRVTGVYEAELGIRLTLVAQNDQFVYTNAATDIFTTPGPNDASMTSAQNRFIAVLTSANYDVGHLYHRAANSGVAGGIGTVCSTTKGRGVSQTEPPVGDPFSVDYVAHELGHQFGGRHSFNNCSGGPGDAADIAHEPGSGITIMGYAGICGDNDLANNSVPHFASINYDQIRAYVTSTGACGPQSSTGNNAPTVSAGPDFVIPASTPFILTASGSDPDGDAVTFSWEQRDGGTATPITGFFDNGTNPLVRFESPTTSPVRYIPRLSSLANNSFFLGEILPTTSRVLDFRAVVRDNRAGGGGLNFDDMTVTVVPSATGAFRVTSPSTAQSWIGGETRTVTWVVSNTASAPINTANVSIWFSADNGQTWPTQLVSSTPNDGEATITVPSVNTTQGRIMVRAVNNIFFNINQGGTITVLAPVAGVDLRSGGAVTIADNVGNGNANTRVDVGESAIQLTIPVSNLGLTTATNVTGTLTSLTPTATVVSNTATYPAITSLTNANNASAFVVSVSPSHPCGSPIALQFAVTSAQGSGSFNISLPTGVPGGPGPANRYIYAGSPVPLGTGNAGPVNVPLVVARSNGTIADINFSFDGTACNAADAATTNGVSQTWNGDMTYTLISPAGTRVTLFNQRGGSGNHLCNTLFDDSASTAIASVGTTLTNLFSGAWRPESPLSAFNGQSPLGTWNLELRDAFASADAATVRGFSVYVSELLAPVCEPPAAGCDSIDFNNNSVFPEDQDVVDFFNVLAGGSCPTCGDIDFNNNGVFPEDQDVIDFFNVLAGGDC
ncbi:MAG TPA: zinc-dependent metalloprotease family protein [Phycisphaerales bacterium]|nr:zinc-dependent metalloprotease family protein [Phycisphaerales bacterium]